MNKLAKILQLTELFYKKAMQALAAAPAYVMSEDPAPLEKAKEILDEIDNNELGIQIERLIEFYNEFTKSLSGPPPGPDENTPLDWREALKARVHELQKNPYLYLEEDDPEYTETVSPHEIFQMATDLLDAADSQLETKAKSGGLDKEDVEAAKAAARKDMGLPQAAKDAENKLDAARQQEFADKVARQLAHQKAYNEKLKFAKKIGYKGLLEQAANLKAAIVNTTDPVKKEQLENQVKLIERQAESVRKAKEGLERRHNKMKEDPVRFGKHQQDLVSRQATRRKVDEKRFELVEKLQKATSPEEQRAIVRELVNLEKAVLTRKKVDFESDEFKNDPEQAKLIDPNEIIKRHLASMARQKHHRTKEVDTRRAQRAAGEMVGLLKDLTQQLSDLVNNIKKNLQKKIDKQGHTDPFFEPYVQALSAAASKMQIEPSPANKSALEKAQADILQAAKQYKDQHTLVIEMNSKLEPWVQLKEELQAVAGLSRKTSAPRSPWFYADELPEDKRLVLQDFITKSEQGARILGGAVGDTLQKISNKLKEKL